MNYKNLIIALIITAVVLATFIGARTTHIPSHTDEMAKIEQSVAEKQKPVSEELLPFEPYDVPLDEDLQLYVYELSERYSIPMELILAVIGQESNYDPTKIGDGGDSYGLMQVQPKWHGDRMEKFNVHEKDLLNPYANCLIGVDYLAECIGKGDLEWGLMCYNGGPQHANTNTEIGVITEYAESVIYLSENL